MQDLCANTQSWDTDLTRKEEECALSELPENPPPLGVAEQELTLRPMGNILLKDKQMARHSVMSIEHLKSLIRLMKVSDITGNKAVEPSLCAGRQMSPWQDAST